VAFLEDFRAEVFGAAFPDFFLAEVDFFEAAGAAAE